MPCRPHVAQVNRNVLGFANFAVEDAGGTIVMYVFGAYFGLTAAKVLGPPPKDQANLNNASSNVSNILSLVGTIFLWVFWPALNGGAFTSDPVMGGRAIANTVVALLCSCTCTFMISGIIGGKLTPAHVQKATLAGGVAVGAVARMNIGLGWASIIGSIGAILSTLGCQYLQPFLERKLGMYDPCGVHNLFGLPGLFGSIMSCIFTSTAWEQWMPWPQNQIQQYQLACLGTTLGMALATGAVTGCILRFCKWVITKVKAPKTDHDDLTDYNDVS
jgi:ammonium transporter Rh